MLDPNTDSYKNLYCDAAGEVIGLDEVQLMEPIPAERVVFLRELFASGSEYERYQAALVLVAWNDPDIFARLDWYLDQLMARSGEALSPDRLHSVDTACDWVAGALSISLLNGARVETVDYYTRKLLAGVTSQYYRSGLQSLLVKTTRPVLVADLEMALRGAFEAAQQSKAALFLEPIARVEPMLAWSLIATLPWDPAVRPSPMFEIADALAFIKSAESRQYLEWLLHDQGPGVADRAAKVLSSNPPE